MDEVFSFPYHKKSESSRSWFGGGEEEGGGGDTAESAPGQSYSICRKYISFIHIVYYNRI